MIRARREGRAEGQAEECERLIALILRERRRRSIAAIRSLWRIGDVVLRLKKAAGSGNLRRALQACASRAGIHVGSLDAAARAAAAFRAADREALARRFERAGAELTPSQIVELAGAPLPRRREAVETLLRKRLSIRELRSYLDQTV